jgi:hypothetical protein
MMLDVLFKIKDEQDPALVFRRSCRHVFARAAQSAHSRCAAHPPAPAADALRAACRVPQRGHLRQLCDEHQRAEHAGVPVQG